MARPLLTEMSRRPAARFAPQCTLKLHHRAHPTLHISRGLDRVGRLSASFTNVEKEGGLKDLFGPGDRIATWSVPSGDSAKPFQTGYDCPASFAAGLPGVILTAATCQPLLERAVHTMDPQLGAGCQRREFVQLADGGHHYLGGFGLIDTHSLNFRGSCSKHYEPLFREELSVYEPISAL
jgi:hypothetical protein